MWQWVRGLAIVAWLLGSALLLPAMARGAEPVAVYAVHLVGAPAYTNLIEPYTWTDITGASVTFTLTEAASVAVVVDVRGKKANTVHRFRVAVMDGSTRVAPEATAGYDGWYSVYVGEVSGHQLAGSGVAALGAGSHTLRLQEAAALGTSRLDIYEVAVTVTVIGASGSGGEGPAGPAGATGPPCATPGASAEPCPVEVTGFSGGALDLVQLLVFAVVFGAGWILGMLAWIAVQGLRR